MTARQALYEGRVQGVGFRWTVKNLARGYEVTGWIKNLPDGRVELQICGHAEELDAFLEAIEESDLKAHIHASDVRPIAPFHTGSFEIVQ